VELLLSPTTHPLRTGISHFFPPVPFPNPRRLNKLYWLVFPAISLLRISMALRCPRPTRSSCIFRSFYLCRNRIFSQLKEDSDIYIFTRPPVLIPPSWLTPISSHLRDFFLLPLTTAPLDISQFAPYHNALAFFSEDFGRLVTSLPPRASPLFFID